MNANRQRFKRQMRHHQPTRVAWYVIEAIIKEAVIRDMADVLFRESPIMRRLKAGDGVHA